MAWARPPTRADHRQYNWRKLVHPRLATVIASLKNTTLRFNKIFSAYWLTYPCHFPSVEEMLSFLRLMSGGKVPLLGPRPDSGPHGKAGSTSSMILHCAAADPHKHKRCRTGRRQTNTAAKPYRRRLTIYIALYLLASRSPSSCTRQASMPVSEVKTCLHRNTRSSLPELAQPA